MTQNNNTDKSLEQWLWDVACSIRGAKDALKYKDYTLPLVFALELLDMDRDIGDQIVHELLHAVVPNHGKLWKSLMRAHLGEYEQLEAKLARHNRQEK